MADPVRQGGYAAHDLTLIRAAVPGDAAAIAAVHVRSWHETYTGLIPQRVIDRRTKPDERVAEWTRGLAGSRDVVLVAEVDAAVCGFAWAGVDPELQGRAEVVPGFDAHLFAMYVVASRHGNGIGRGLLRAVATALLAEGRRSLSLQVLSSNPARRFYERLGAKFVGYEEIRDEDDVWQQCVYGWPDVTALVAEQTP